MGKIDVLSAAAEGSVDQVSKYLMDGGGICVRDKEGRTPLVVALETRQEGLCKELLGKGARDEGTDTRGRTPLMLALEGRDEGICTTLLERGANVSARDTMVWFCVMLASLMWRDGSVWKEGRWARGRGMHCGGGGVMGGVGGVYG